MSADLVAFLRARLDEDEAVAVHSWCEDWRFEPNPQLIGGRVLGQASAEIVNDWNGPAYRAVSYHIARHDPARVLRQVEAGRAIVDNCERARIAIDSVPMADRVSSGDDTVSAYWRGQHFVLRVLAAAYSDHPDYREEWAL